MIVGIYTSSRLAGGAGRAASKSRWSRGGDIHPEPDTLLGAQHGWRCHPSWLDLAQLPEHPLLGCPSAPPWRGDIAPTLWCPSFPPAAPHRGTGELNIPSAHHWCVNYEPPREKAERAVDRRKIPTGCSAGGLALQDKSSAGWHLPCQASSFAVLGVLQRLRSVHLCLAQPLASAPSAATSGPTHGLL